MITTSLKPFSQKDKLALAIDLLKADRALTKFIDTFKNVGIDICEYKNFPDFNQLNQALDLIGIPKDNTVETGAYEKKAETGNWPEESYCRDWVYWEWQDWKGTPKAYLQHVFSTLNNNRIVLQNEEAI